MSEKDLMIGDNVTFGSEAHKVLTINSDGVVFLDGCDDLIPIGLIEPIPITPEILEKNGFEIVGPFSTFRCGDIYINSIGTSGRFNIEVKDIVRSYVDVQKEYVHELQHVLRLCGIDKEIEV